RVAAPSSRVPAWTGWAAAASLLFAIGAGSYFYFTNAANENSLAGTDKPRLTANAAHETGPEQGPGTLASSATKPVESVKDGKEPKEATPTVVAQNSGSEPATSRTATPASTPKSQDTAIAAPEQEMFQPRKVDVPLALLLKVRDLD